MVRLGHQLIFSSILLATGLVWLTSTTQAQSITELETQINERNQAVIELQKEIARYEQQLNVLSNKRNTLQSTIDSIALQQKKLEAEISVTRNRIGSANLEISELSISIDDKEAIIKRDKEAIASAVREIVYNEQSSLVMHIFSAHSLTEAWAATDAATQFNRALHKNIIELKETREALSNNRDSVSEKKAELLSYQQELATQKRSVDASKNAQQKLLSQTKNQESNYQALIAEKREAEEAFEQELLDLQSQLDLIVNPSTLPKVGSGVLTWPFSTEYMRNCAKKESVYGNIFCITQYFGNTAFATANPQIYNGRGHSGADFGAPDGTPIHAALSGTVLGVGNTDLARDSKGRKCYSFGKWVMIKHGNGINTLYSHLSEIDVSKGESVSTGEVIGLSGRTGYATGPHLHFGVYATEGTKITTLAEFRGTKTPCANALMPVATLDAYLNPLSYL